MMPLKRLLGFRKKGLITEHVFFIELSEHVMTTGVDSTLSEIPLTTAKEFRAWLADIPPTGVRVLGSNLTAEDSERLGSRLVTAASLVEMWFKQKE